MRTRRRSLPALLAALLATVLATLFLSALPACKGSGSPAKKKAAPARPRGPALRVKRVAVLGASLSAGVGAKPLAALLRRTLPPGVTVLDCANAMTFERPYTHTRRQVACAQSGHADAVIALDSLFWFAYHNRGYAAKQAYLEVGLRVLEPLKVPLFLGDLPDMRSASQALIPRSHLPSPDTLHRLNARIHAWADARPHVRVLPFSAWARPLLSKGRIVPAPGQRAIPAADALHIDGLHPNGKGTLYILSRTLVAIRKAYPGTPPDRFRLTPALIRDLLRM